VRDGDWITIDLSSRLLSVELSEFELLFEVCGLRYAVRSWWHASHNGVLPKAMFPDAPCSTATRRVCPMHHTVHWSCRREQIHQHNGTIQLCSAVSVVKFFKLLNTSFGITFSMRQRFKQPSHLTGPASSLRICPCLTSRCRYETYHEQSACQHQVQSPSPFECPA
jgi:hypothetical protein